eukprot:gene9542-6839_t
MSIKAVCDDGFQSVVLFGPDSIVEDVYNHVLAVRTNRPNDNTDLSKRYATKIKLESGEQSSQRDETAAPGKKGKAKPAAGVTFAYVLPSMKISSIFESSKAPKEIYLEGFRAVDNSVTVVKDLKVLSTKLREVDSIVQSTIASHESGIVVPVQVLESVRSQVRTSLDSVHECLSSVSRLVNGEGPANERKRPAEVNDIRSPQTNKKMKPSEAKVAPPATPVLKKEKAAAVAAEKKAAAAEKKAAAATAAAAPAPRAEGTTTVPSSTTATASATATATTPAVPQVPSKVKTVIGAPKVPTAPPTATKVAPMGAAAIQAAAASAMTDSESEDNNKAPATKNAPKPTAKATKAAAAAKDAGSDSESDASFSSTKAAPKGPATASKATSAAAPAAAKGKAAAAKATKSDSESEAPPTAANASKPKTQTQTLKKAAPAKLNGTQPAATPAAPPAPTTSSMPSSVKPLPATHPFATLDVNVPLEFSQSQPDAHEVTQLTAAAAPTTSTAAAVVDIYDVPSTAPDGNDSQETTLQPSSVGSSATANVTTRVTRARVAGTKPTAAEKPTTAAAAAPAAAAPAVAPASKKPPLVTPAKKINAKGFVPARERLTATDTLTQTQAASPSVSSDSDDDGSDSDASTPIAPRSQQTPAAHRLSLSQASSLLSLPAPPAALQKLLVDSTVHFKPPSHFLPSHAITATPAASQVLTQSQDVLTSSSDDDDDDSDDGDKDAPSRSAAYWSQMAASSPSKFVDTVLSQPTATATTTPKRPPMASPAMGNKGLRGGVVSGTKNKPVTATSSSAAPASGVEDNAVTALPASQATQSSNGSNKTPATGKKKGTAAAAAGGGAKTPAASAATAATKGLKALIEQSAESDGVVDLTAVASQQSSVTPVAPPKKTVTVSARGRKSTGGTAVAAPLTGNKRSLDLTVAAPKTPAASEKAASTTATTASSSASKTNSQAAATAAVNTNNKRKKVA